MTKTRNHDVTATGSRPIVEIEGLTKAYDGRVVVDHLDLEIQPGEVVGLIGANGAGKTTTVEIMQGLRRADAGRVRVCGLDPIRDADRLRPQIGSQLQSSALPDRMRVAEAVQLFAEPYADDPERLLEEFGLAHRRKYPFAGMSGGEQQRLFLVLALLNRPRIVILDELTQGLDPVARRDVWQAVKRLRDGGTTVLLVTHELAEASELCERVIAMRDGKVLAQGTPRTLIERYAGAATVGFTLQAPTAGGLAEMLQELNALPGVGQVRRDGDVVELRGAKEMIAHVGAWLVGTGRPVPADLAVETPGLESALVALLDGRDTDTDHELQGAA